MEFLPLIDQFAKANNLNILPLQIEGFISYKISIDDLTLLLTFIKESKDLRFTIITDLFAADFPNRSDARFEVVYNLLSLKLNQRLLLKIAVGEKDSVPSVVNIFSGACWYEREVFDMFGIHFDGSVDLRRILTDYGFSGHPLRKDFPVTGYTQVKYDTNLEQVVYEPILFEQEFRDFDFSSPWKGVEINTFHRNKK